LTGVKRVREILKYLISDKSSWIQNGAKDPDGYDLRVVWNGAKEEDHKSSGANGYSDTPVVLRRAGRAAPSLVPPKPHERSRPPVLLVSLLFDQMYLALDN
jgi:hypothetical protein